MTTIQKLYKPKTAFGNTKLLKAMTEEEARLKRLEAIKKCDRCDDYGSRKETCDNCNGDGTITIDCEHEE